MVGKNNFFPTEFPRTMLLALKQALQMISKLSFQQMHMLGSKDQERTVGRSPDDIVRAYYL